MTAEQLQQGISDAYWQWDMIKFSQVIGAEGNRFYLHRNYQALQSLYTTLIQFDDRALQAILDEVEREQAA